jgi:hypothetical protein
MVVLDGILVIDSANCATIDGAVKLVGSIRLYLGHDDDLSLCFNDASDFCSFEIS